MTRQLLVGALIITSSILTGCSRFTLDARDLRETVSMTRNTGIEAESRGAVRFEARTRVGYCGWLFNLVTLKDANISAILEKEIRAAGGSSVRNLTIKKEMSFVDGLISIVSLSFYVPETITISGEVVP